MEVKSGIADIMQEVSELVLYGSRAIVQPDGTKVQCLYKYVSWCFTAQG